MSGLAATETDLIQVQLMYESEKAELPKCWPNTKNCLSWNRLAFQIHSLFG